MNIFRLTRYEKIFTIKVIIITTVIVASVIISYNLFFKDKSSYDTKLATNHISQQLSQSKIPLYYEFECIGGIAKIKQCDGKYFEKFIEILESKNIHKSTGGIYMKQDVSFIIHYYAGPPTRCIENLCPEYSYYVQMDIQYNKEILPEFGIKHEYKIEHGKNGIHGNVQLEKIEEIGPLKFEQIEKFMKFLSELSKEKQKALVK